MVQNGTVDFAVMNTAIDGISDILLQEVMVHERVLLVMNWNIGHMVYPGIDGH